MYLGMIQLGKYLDITLQATSAAGAKSMPTYVPYMKVYNNGALIQASDMPLVDKNIQVGLFWYPLFLGSTFSVGHGTVDMHYRVGDKFGIESRTFEIVPGGNAEGQVMGMHYYARPHADYIVYSMESGILRQGKNPRVA